MKATAHFEWESGHKIQIPCTWNDDGSIDEDEEIATRIYASEEADDVTSAEGELVDAFVQADDDPSVKKEIHFEQEFDMEPIIFTKPIRRKKHTP